MTPVITGKGTRCMRSETPVPIGLLHSETFLPHSSSPGGLKFKKGRNTHPEFLGIDHAKG